LDAGPLGRLPFWIRIRDDGNGERDGDKAAAMALLLREADGRLRTAGLP